VSFTAGLSLYDVAYKRWTIFGLLALTRVFVASELETRVNRFCGVGLTHQRRYI